MSPPGQRRRQALAAIVTVAGALAIWTFASMRQEGQTEALSRRWVGEQWDVARQCLLGTPIGRSRGPEAIEPLLEARLLETLTAASERPPGRDGTPDVDVLWPTRCVPRLADLHVDPSILDGDPSEALATLEVLAPRVIRAGPDGPGAFALGGAAERARELAAPIAVLDDAMPPGAEYEPTRFRAAIPRVPAGDVIASLACGPVPERRRPFFASWLGQSALFDELETADRSLRLTGEPDAITLAVASTEGTETHAIAARGRHPRFWDPDTLLWLDELAVVRAPIGEGDADSVPTGVQADAMALCRAADVGHLILRSEAGPRWVRIEGTRASAPARVTPAPPDAGVVMACSPSTVALSWLEDGRWIGVRCQDDSCRSLPVLSAGGDLQLAVRGDDVLAVARGRRTDLSLARTLEGESWSEPTPVLRGRSSVEDDRFRLTACEDLEHRSRDGRTWVRVSR